MIGFVGNGKGALSTRHASIKVACTHRFDTDIKGPRLPLSSFMVQFNTQHAARAICAARSRLHTGEVLVLC